MKDDKIVYINGDLTFVTPIGSDSNHLLCAFFAGYTIDNVVDLEKLECIFMDDIKKIHIKEDVFVTESPEWLYSPWNSGFFYFLKFSKIMFATSSGVLSQVSITKS